MMTAEILECGSCAGCGNGAGSVRGFDVVPGGAGLRAVLREIFTDSFMHEYTNFDDFDCFCFSSAVIVNWEADTLIYARERLDSFVNESTRFSAWEEMVMTAAQKKYC